MDGPWKHDAERKKPITKGHASYDSIYMKSSKKAKPWRQRVD